MTSHWLAGTAFAVALLSAACSKHIDDGGSATVDFSNPKRVVSSVFFAAQNEQSDHLAGLCDPEGEGNAFVDRICSETVGGGDWPKFVRQFSKGTLIGEPRISGDRAMVNFAFGPEGTDPETMELVNRDGKWYLLAF